MPYIGNGRLYCALLLIYNSTTVLAQAQNATQPAVNLSGPHSEASTTSPPPQPPACNIQTSVCLSAEPAGYVYSDPLTRPQALRSSACLVSYTNDKGVLVFPEVDIATNGEKDSVPCATNMTMSAETVYGVVEVTYRANYSGIPADPWFK